ncbi:MAG: TatD family hydrolase [Planctomycetia bacterium]|nr:MAG: TatD family hydrolase [Planctomycetia bacterium]
MAGLIDSHCHLTYEGLVERIDHVIESARTAGVDEFVTISTDLRDAARAQALAERRPCIHVVSGIHPHQAAQAEQDWEPALEAIVRRPDVYAVGEMGLDYHYDFSDRVSQVRVFEGQLALAERVNKPVVVHCREAHDDVMAMLANFPRVRSVVFHCFTGTLAQAEQIWSRGYWLSLTGVVTFKRSDELREVARIMPADRLMVETDSPYLSPEPVRSVRPNEPAHLAYTAACIARARGISLEALTHTSAENTRRFFGLPSRGAAPSSEAS